MTALAKAEILNLSVSERIQLVEDIWDMITEVPDKIQLTDQQKSEIGCRLDAYALNPDEGSEWNVVRERIRGRR